MPRRYYKPQQLADYWQMPLDDVMQLGLTEFLQFMIQADFEYPELREVERGAWTKIDYLELANIYHAIEPVVFEGVGSFGKNAGFKCVITFPHGIDRLIILVDEVERFESEHKQITPTIEPDAPENINAKERNNMLKLIYGMARHAYQYDPNAKRNDATGGNKNSISATISQYGIDITDDAIRKFLNDAKKLID